MKRDKRKTLFSHDLQSNETDAKNINAVQNVVNIFMPASRCHLAYRAFQNWCLHWLFLRIPLPDKDVHYYCLLNVFTITHKCLAYICFLPSSINLSFLKYFWVPTRCLLGTLLIRIGLTAKVPLEGQMWCFHSLGL